MALGYSQIPGLDFADNFAPVINDVTLCIILILSIINKWVKEIINVETAFLHGKLEEEIFMKFPQGLSMIEKYNEDTDCVVLKKAMHGLVQAAQ